MVAKLAGMMVMAALLAGCSIRVQAPIREVAYDFSDRDFYDRAYAPSPAYAESTSLVYAEPGPPPTR
jgi:hypothetical protein